MSSDTVPIWTLPEIFFQWCVESSHASPQHYTNPPSGKYKINTNILLIYKCSYCEQKLRNDQRFNKPNKFFHFLLLRMPKSQRPVHPWRIAPEAQPCQTHPGNNTDTAQKYVQTWLHKSSPYTLPVEWRHCQKHGQIHKFVDFGVAGLNQWWPFAQDQSFLKCDGHYFPAHDNVHRYWKN